LCPSSVDAQSGLVVSTALIIAGTPRRTRSRFADFAGFQFDDMPTNSAADVAHCSLGPRPHLPVAAIKIAAITYIN
jgi:hypothetical protein